MSVATVNKAVGDKIFREAAPVFTVWSWRQMHVQLPAVQGTVLLNTRGERQASIGGLQERKWGGEACGGVSFELGLEGRR